MLVQTASLAGPRDVLPNPRCLVGFGFVGIGLGAELGPSVVRVPGGCGSKGLVVVLACVWVLARGAVLVLVVGP